MGTILTVLALLWCFGIPIALTLGGYREPDHRHGPNPWI